MVPLQSSQWADLRWYFRLTTDEAAAFPLDDFIFDEICGWEPEPFEGPSPDPDEARVEIVREWFTSLRAATS